MAGINLATVAKLWSVASAAGVKVDDAQIDALASLWGKFQSVSQIPIGEWTPDIVRNIVGPSVSPEVCEQICEALHVFVDGREMNLAEFLRDGTWAKFLGGVRATEEVAPTLIRCRYCGELNFL